jgi:lipopolysaccharide assembly outer membrane protein LptD (OstA)
MPGLKTITGATFLLPLIFSFSQDFAQGAETDVPLGRIRITGTNNKYDSEKKIFSADGKVIVIIGGQDSKLTADSVIYDQKSNVLKAFGNVVITRHGELNPAQSFTFFIASKDYLVTEPHTKVTDPLGFPVEDVPEKSLKHQLVPHFCLQLP